MRRTTFELGNFVTIIPYWYNKHNKYSRSVKEANLSIFQQEVQSTQHKTSFFFIIICITTHFSFGTQCDTISAVFSPALLYCFSSLSFDETSAITWDNWGSMFLQHCFLQPFVVWCVSLSVSPLLDQLYSCSFSECWSCKLFHVGSGLHWPPWSHWHKGLPSQRNLYRQDSVSFSASCFPVSLQNLVHLLLASFAVVL